LDQLPGVGKKMAGVLEEAGFTTVSSLASASLDALKALPGIGEKKALALRQAATEALEERELAEGETPKPQADQLEEVLAPEAGETLITAEGREETETSLEESPSPLGMEAQDEGEAAASSEEVCSSSSEHEASFDEERD
jgi:predicted RecB family nuclease